MLASSVAAGGVAFDPQAVAAASSTTVAATFAGSDPAYPPSFLDVSVTVPTITVSDITGFGNRIGSGLQSLFRVTLQSANHPGVTIRVLSADPSAVLVSPDTATSGLTLGTPFVDLPFAPGQSTRDFVVQGIGAPSIVPVTLTASQQGGSILFQSGTSNVTVEDVQLGIFNLGTTKSVASSNDAFIVRPVLRQPANTGSGVWGAQALRAGASPITVTLTSSDPAVGLLTTLSGTAAQATVVIEEGQSLSPQSVAAGGVEFDSVGAGTTDVQATATGFDPAYPPATVSVTVNP